MYEGLKVLESLCNMGDAQLETTLLDHHSLLSKMINMPQEHVSMHCGS